MVNELYMSVTFFRPVLMPSTKYRCWIVIALIGVGASQNNEMVTSLLKKKKVSLTLQEETWPYQPENFQQEKKELRS